MSHPKILPEREYWVSNSGFTCDMSLFRHKTSHSPGFGRRCGVSKQLFLLFPKMWLFPRNFVQMWQFCQVVLSFFLGSALTEHNHTRASTPGLWVPVFSDSGWGQPSYFKYIVNHGNPLDRGAHNNTLERRKTSPTPVPWGGRFRVHVLGRIQKVHQETLPRRTQQPNSA